MVKEDQERIYKYMAVNQFLYEMLINQEMWFSSPMDFNDPFDCNLPLNQMYEGAIIMNHLGWSTEMNSEERIQKTLVPYYFKTALDTLRENIGVQCFSAVKDNLTMWAHYANHHKGVMIEFDKKLLLQNFPEIVEVIYTDDVEKIDYNLPASDIFKNLVDKKSTDWRLEEEVRIIVQRPGLYKFSMEAVKAIKFGLKCDKTHISSILEIRKKFGYQFNVTQAVESSYGYKLGDRFL